MGAGEGKSQQRTAIFVQRVSDKIDLYLLASLYGKNVFFRGHHIVYRDRDVSERADIFYAFEYYIGIKMEI